MPDDCCPAPQYRNSILVTVRLNGVSITENIEIAGDNPRFFAKGVDNALITAANRLHKMIEARFGEQQP